MKALFIGNSATYVNEIPQTLARLAETGKFGAYLIVCTFFATLFGVSATLLDANGLDVSDAAALQRVADKIVFDGVIPWAEQ